MSVHTRPDIAQYRRLDSIVSLSGMSFENVMRLILGFLVDELPAMPAKYDLKIDGDVLSNILRRLNAAQDVWSGKSSRTALVESRIAVWKIHDQQPADSDSRRVARVAVCGTYDEDAAEFSNYGSAAVFEAFFSTLLDLHPDCCRLFADHAAREIGDRDARAR